jgi:5-methylthioadenosine/S-adenosylhomocysteine deaminase
MPNSLLVRGGRVFDLDGDVDRPDTADILVAGGKIVAIRKGLAEGIEAGAYPPELAGEAVERTIDARGKLIVPGLINAHYHSHDVLLKGCFEGVPLELWFMLALPPAYPKRSTREIRARTLLGAVECLRGGITTIQDLATIYPFDEEHVDTILRAYDDVGIRCVFALQVADLVGSSSVPFWDKVIPEALRGSLSGAVEPFAGDRRILQVIEDSIRAHRNRHPRITWALGPSAPERCSESFLRDLAGLSEASPLPVFTHVYESKATTLIARQTHESDNGSLIRYLERCGLLTPKLTLAHSVWMRQFEIDMIRAHGANVVLNPISNLKLRNGVAPIRAYADSGVNTALGCDNCSCSDCQNMFQAMKMFCSLAGLENPEPGRPFATDAIRAATHGGARATGLEGVVGALKVGMAADFALLDLADPSFVPLNSAARQLVYTESGRGVETVVVDGRVVVENRKVVTVDEAALYEEIDELIGPLMSDLGAIRSRLARMTPYLEEASRLSLNADIGLNRYVRG